MSAWKSYIRLVPWFLSYCLLLGAPQPLRAQQTDAPSNTANETSAPKALRPQLPTLNTVPPLLRDWLTWVEQRHPEFACPRINGSRECLWPGQARYEILEKGAKFALEVHLFAESLVPLPNSPELPIHNVEVIGAEGRLAPLVLERSDEGLSIRLPAGMFTVRGEFTWTTKPDELPVSPLYGLVAVSESNAAPVRIERGEDSFRVIDPEHKQADDALTLRVIRRLVDGSPAELETRLILRVSGAPRSLRLGRVIPENALPVSISSNVPTQLQKDGSLAVQLIPGEHTLTIRSIIGQPISALVLPAPEMDFWPKEETFIWVPNNALRAVEVSGASPLSAELSQIPADWAGGATYVGTKGARLELRELSRGELQKPPGSIRLSRELWLDLDGAGLTARDVFMGTLTSSDRLNALPETQVARATINGEQLLIAPDPSTKAAGIEIRESNLNVEAVSRLNRTHSFSAVGWSQMVDTYSLAVWLPPSWQLLWVSGSTGTSGAWLDSWTLLDVFLSILTCLAAFHLFGGMAAVVAAIIFILNHGEFLAPRLLFVHLLLLTLWRVTIQHKEGTWYRLNSLLIIVTFAAWALQALAFMKLQVTQLIYPQLQAGTRYRTALQELIGLIDASLFMWPYLLFLIGFAFLAVRSILRGPTWPKIILRVIVWGFAGFLVLGISGTAVVGSLLYFGSSNQMSGGYWGGGSAGVSMESEHYADYSSSDPAAAPNRLAQGKFKQESSMSNSSGFANSQGFSYKDKVFQAGPALPEWRWRSQRVNVDGPIAPEHQLTFMLLSPIQTRLVSLVRIICLGILGILLFRRLGYSLPKIDGPAATSTATTAALAFALWSAVWGAAALGLSVPAAYAEAPTNEMLAELENRIAARQCTGGQCSVIVDSRFVLTEKHFVLDMTVSSDGRSTMTIPGPMTSLLPTEVMIGGKPTTALRRNEQNFLQVQLEDGSSHVVMKGEILESAAFSIQFPDHPQFVAIDTNSWFVEGISESGHVGENVRCTSRAAADREKRVGSASTAEVLPQWITVSRNVTIADQISVETTVTRLGSAERSITTPIPLLASERITSSGVRIEGTQALVALPAGEAAVTFTSALPYANSIRLTAKPMDRLSEEWTVQCAPIVHCVVSELKPTDSIQRGALKYRWLPYGGEEAVVTIEPLSGIPGDVLTVDSLKHQLTWGTNLIEGEVTTSVRATQQHSLIFTLPANSTLRSVSLNAANSPTQLIEGKVPVLLNPGSHRIVVSYVLPKTLETKEVAPLVLLNIPAHNVTVEVRPGVARWILWTGGLAWGPAVVFWSKMFFVCLLTALAAARGLLPTSVLGAIALGIGLSTLPLVIMVFPLIWLVVLALREPIAARISPRCPNWLSITMLVGVTLLALILFYRIVQIGLVLQPPMLIAGNLSTANSLRWFLDHAETSLPQPWVISLPMMWWRGFALAWATWLTLSLIRWLRMTADIVKGMLK